MMDGHEKKYLETAEQENRDIGVIIDSHLSFENHIQSQVNKANKFMHGADLKEFYKSRPGVICVSVQSVCPHIE